MTFILAFIIGVIGGASILWLVVVKNKDFFLKVLGATDKQETAEETTEEDNGEEDNG